MGFLATSLTVFLPCHLRCYHHRRNATVTPATAEMASIELSEVEEEIVQTQIIAHVADLGGDEPDSLSEASDSTFGVLKASLVAAGIPEDDAIVLIAKCRSRADECGKGDDGHISNKEPIYKEKDWCV